MGIKKSLKPYGDLMKKYYLKCKNVTIGFFTEEDGELRYTPIREEADKLPILIGYPRGLFEIDKTVTPWIPDKNKVRNEYSIYRWLENRVVSRRKFASRILLQRLGLKEYNAWEIVKKTKGLTYCDNFWITDNIHETFPREKDKKRGDNTDE